MDKLKLREKPKVKRSEVKRTKKEVSFGRCICGNSLSLPVFLLRLMDDTTLEVCYNCYVRYENEFLVVQERVANQLTQNLNNCYYEGGCSYE